MISKLGTILAVSLLAGSFGYLVAESATGPAAPADVRIVSLAADGDPVPEPTTTEPQPTTTTIPVPNTLPATTTTTAPPTTSTTQGAPPRPANIGTGTFTVGTSLAPGTYQVYDIAASGGDVCRIEVPTDNPVLYPNRGSIPWATTYVMGPNTGPVVIPAEAEGYQVRVWSTCAYWG